MAILTIDPQHTHYPAALQTYIDTPLPLTIHSDHRGEAGFAWLQDDTASAQTPIIAFFSSAKISGSLLLRVHELAQSWRSQPLTIISGFQSPAEAEVWSVLFSDIADRRTPIREQSSPRLVKVLARGMVKRLKANEHLALANGYLQLISPFPITTSRVTKETSWQRNLVAAALADRILIANAEPDSQTMALAEHVERWGKPVVHLGGT
ncbi:MAG: hypothetical protein AAF639_00905 [Chloroflexota bacterium]